MTCYRCQYATSDNSLALGGIESGMKELGLTNEQLCQDSPSDKFVVTCAIDGARCGATKATLDLVVKFSK